MSEFDIMKLMKRIPKRVLFGIAVVLSVTWWAFLTYKQLQLDHSCMPDDGMCNSGNTVVGDLTYGTILAFFTLAPLWSIAFCIYFLAKSYRNKNHQPQVSN
jgi:hypothetical protein